MSLENSEDVLRQAMRIMGRRGGLKGGKYGFWSDGPQTGKGVIR